MEENKSSYERNTASMFILEEGRRIDEILWEAKNIGEKTFTLMLRIMSADQHMKWQTYLAHLRMVRAEKEWEVTESERFMNKVAVRVSKILGIEEWQDKTN